MFGFINIYKPKGITSFDVIRVLRKILKLKQIGHSGTLDPMAEGVLPICIGKATKLINYLQEDKAYIASARFGVVSDTCDIEGEIKTLKKPNLTKQKIEELLSEFCGEIEQTPPIYSAIKINGKKLYEYARSGKTEADIEIPVRKVTISEIKLLDFNEQEQTAQIYVACSKGTYIRSIIRDLGEKSGFGALMTDLIRTKSGKFTIDTAIKLEDIKETKDIVKNLINPTKVLSYKNIELDENEYQKIIVGQTIPAKNNKNGEIVILTKNNIFVSIANVIENRIKVIKVFV